MSTFRNLKIGRRLALAFGVVLLILVLSISLSVWRLHQLSTRMHAMATVDNLKQQLAAQWLATVTLNSVRTRAALIGPVETVAEIQRDIDSTSADTTRMREELSGLINTTEGRAMLAAIDSARDAFRTPRSALFKRRLAGDDVKAAADEQLAPLNTAYVGALRNFQERQKKLYDEALAGAENDAVQSQQVLLGAGVLAVLLGLFFAVTLSRSITGPLRQALATTRRIADGDLTDAIDIRGKDEAAELLTALNAMQVNLSRVVSGVRSNAEGVATASAQIAQGNNDLSGRTEQQASALQQTAASMEELSSTVRQNSDNAQQANQLAQGATNVAVQGGEVVAKVVDTMKGINESSRKISDIISVIDGIAFQTNILALNAAVEAARAGEQGRGFAVVASEVRSLAQRSAEAAKQIKGLIGTSVERVEQGTALVDQAGTTMQEVVSAIRRVTDLMGEISAASVEQSAGVAQVGEAVTQMDQATQQNAALVEESAAAAASLRSQADQLVDAVAVFKLSGQPGLSPSSRVATAFVSQSNPARPPMAPAASLARIAPRPAAAPALKAFAKPAISRPVAAAGAAHASTATPKPAFKAAASGATGTAAASATSPARAPVPKPATKPLSSSAPATAGAQRQLPASGRTQPPAAAPASSGGSDDDWETF
jgi:methyl-accepting chemotaxis protein